MPRRWRCRGWEDGGMVVIRSWRARDVTDSVVSMLRDDSDVVDEPRSAVLRVVTVAEEAGLRGTLCVVNCAEQVPDDLIRWLFDVQCARNFDLNWVLTTKVKDMQIGHAVYDSFIRHRRHRFYMVIFCHAHLSNSNALDMQYASRYAIVKSRVRLMGRVAVRSRSALIVSWPCYGSVDVQVALVLS